MRLSRRGLALERYHRNITDKGLIVTGKFLFDPSKTKRGVLNFQNNPADSGTRSRVAGRPRRNPWPFGGGSKCRKTRIASTGWVGTIETLGTPSRHRPNGVNVGVPDQGYRIGDSTLRGHTTFRDGEGGHDPQAPATGRAAAEGRRSGRVSSRHHSRDRRQRPVDGLQTNLLKGSMCYDRHRIHLIPDST